ncbi:aminoacyl-histidine dipeptidase [Kushneria phosphatilytica]|uniref:Cytosol non-specific dipeptidase n=1 Tax=Kushneria phosphatilytica TaxID=657387 RepID=A0A5C0ZWX9_9GAMM|nr:aminoacyl-histidine dipeptidase [Kushneria phosphatilytica]QEL09853.1 aminoacyl-histidine dipeptidase [Kushneria phosphatilytica]
MNEHLETMEPTLLWRHFRTFCNTPRPSGKEEALARKIEAWADERGLHHERDEAGNLLLRKPASPGYEQASGVVLQGHLDMVSQAAPGVEHDFERDPIETHEEGGWLHARGTTLGADNGIGAAAGLAILDDEQLTHGPLEVLLTVEEEASLVGAIKLREQWLQGRLLLNLDSEDEGQVYIGCAGGASVSTEVTFDEAPLGEGMAGLKIGVHGLQGGHSGLDIHKGLGNANRLLARLLNHLAVEGLQLADYDGGTMGNAITREAWATVAFPRDRLDYVTDEIERFGRLYREELEGVDEGVTVSHEPAAPDRAVAADDSRRIVGVMHALPYGVAGMSRSAPGVVETSNNMGIVRLAQGKFRLQLMVRSLRDSARDELVARLCTLLTLTGFEPHTNQGYPGWTPDPQAPLLARFERVHEATTGEAPEVKVVHAGLECGLIGAKHPEMQMISFGPTIRGAHSPDERVDIGAVQNFYAVLRAMIEDLAQQ